jgi:hypothetical protein
MRWLLLAALLPSAVLHAVGTGGDLSTLARLLTVEDELTRWGFAGIVLDELLSAYEVELEASYRSPGRTVERRRRLNHWQRGTEGYIAMLYGMRVRLDEGEAFELFVDAQQQIVIAIGEQVVLAGGPRSDLSKQIETRIVQQFCLYNDCAWRGLRSKAYSQPRSMNSLGRGQWSALHGGRLRYVVDGRMVFEFDVVSARDHIAAQADQATDELQLLADEFMRARQQLVTIEWLAIAEDLAGIRNHGNVILNADSDYIELQLPIMQRLTVADWRRVVGWVQQGAAGRLTFPRADSLF